MEIDVEKKNKQIEIMDVEEKEGNDILHEEDLEPNIDNLFELQSNPKDFDSLITPQLEKENTSKRCDDELE